MSGSRYDSGFSKLAQKEYEKRHDNLVKTVHWQLVGSLILKDKWYKWYKQLQESFFTE